MELAVAASSEHGRKVRPGGPAARAGVRRDSQEVQGNPAHSRSLVGLHVPPRISETDSKRSLLLAPDKQAVWEDSAGYCTVPMPSLTGTGPLSTKRIREKTGPCGAHHTVASHQIVRLSLLFSSL